MSFSEQLKSQLDIVSVIGQYVRLKRSGAAHRFVGLCPFHSERSPSFNVNAANQFYYCFGCQATGDVFKFVQEMESLTFPEVLEALAERHGIPVPAKQRGSDPNAQKTEALLEMHALAADLFQNNLRSTSGEDARCYLQSRGVSKGVADEFRLGLADASGQQLTTRLQRFGVELMIESGLVKKRESGGFFDAFRGRLMFPIHSEQGKVIAFGGRALRPDDQPKYLNSPETKIYKKSTVLYNMHRAKIDARKHDRMLLVEGYMDAIGVYAAGVHEVVAVCGTSLSNDQVRSIKRQVAQGQASGGQVILNFDPDAAGAKSAEKYIASFLAEGLRVRVLELPDGKDPDEYIRDQGIDSYAQQLASAASYFDWLSDRVRSRFDMQTPEGRVDAFKALLPSVQLVSDKAERAAIILDLSERLKLDRDVVAQYMRQAKRPGDERTWSAARSATSSIPPNELLLLTCLLQSADAREAIQHYLSNSSVLALLETRAIFERVVELHQTGETFSVGALSAALDSRYTRILADLSLSDLAVDEEAAAQQAIHCLRALETKAQAAQVSDLRRRVREAEQAGKLEEALSLMEALNRAQSTRP